MKVEAQLNNQPTIRNLAKLLMNSMYGRFGMHTERSQTSLVTSSDFENIYIYLFNILSNVELKEYNLINYTYANADTAGNTKKDNLLREYFHSLNQRTNVALASAVTAYSRMIINEHKLNAIKLGAELYYSDTDSMVINKELPSTLVDPAKLGYLKLEYEITEGIFALPKVYYLKTVDGKEVLKAKGYPKTLTRQNYIDLINERTITKLLKYSLEIMKKIVTPKMIDSTILGKLKLEHTIKEGIFVMPKVYYLETSEGQIVTKTKGLPGKLNKEQYLQLLEGKNINNLLITKWQHSLKDSEVKILRNQSYTVQFTFNKRHRILENGKWINTRPIVLNKN